MKVLKLDTKYVCLYVLSFEKHYRLIKAISKGHLGEAELFRKVLVGDFRVLEGEPSQGLVRQTFSLFE